LRAPIDSDRTGIRVKKPPKTDKKAKRRGNESALSRLLASPGRTALVIFAVAFVVYANSIAGGFVWDDQDLIVNNPSMGKLGAKGIAGLFSAGFWTDYESASYYRPLVAATYQIQYRIFNGNPAGFHFVNVVWNALVCVLVFYFIYLLLRNAVTAAVAALLFALHPIHTESVAWIAGRTDVLSTLWAMASLVLYAVARQRSKTPLIAAAWVAFLVSLLAKESSVFVPLVVVLLELPPLRSLLLRRADQKRDTATAVTGVAGYFVCVGLYLALRSHALQTTVSSYSDYAQGALGLIGLPLSVFAGYVGKILFPFRLNAEWDSPVPHSLADVHVIAGLVLLAAIVYAALRYRRVPEVVLGAAFFVFGLAPVLNIIPIGEVSAERFLYFPSLGFVLVLGAFFSRALASASPALADLSEAQTGVRPSTMPSARGRQLVWILVVVLVAYAARTVTRNPVWKSEEVLFTETVKAAPNSPRAHVSLGDVALRHGRVSDAIRLYKKALDLDPDGTLALSNLAGVYVQQRRFDDALPLIEHAIEVQPDNAGLQSNLGSLYFEMGRHDDAVAPLERALELNPNQPTAHFNLGLIEFERKNYAAARDHFLRVADLGPGYHMALYYLAAIESAGGNAASARRFAERFLAVHPQNDDYRRGASQILSGQ